MAIPELKEAVALLVRMPLLWIPGIAGGVCAGILWLTLFISGAFFTSRLLIISLLVMLFFTTGMLSAIRNNEATGRALLSGGLSYYFRVLLPLLVIGSSVLLVFFLCIFVFTFLGLASDIGLVVALSFGVMIPTLMLTFFFDTAAVFEDRRVFESIQRSILLVSDHVSEVLSFFIVSALLCAGVTFFLMIVWELALLDRMQPFVDFTETQPETFTPDQFFAIFGQDGIWVTGIVLFIGFLILLPLLISYKACFYKKMAGSVKIEQKIYGEFDSKGRWYKY